MNQMVMTFTETRSRRNDCNTSKEAAKAAVTRKADAERQTIRRTIKAYSSGLTAREVAAATGIDYHTIQRRIGECGLSKTDLVRDGCRVWVAA